MPEKLRWAALEGYLKNTKVIIFKKQIRFD